MVDHPSENTDGSFSKPKPNYNPIWRKKNDLHQTLILNCQIEIKSLTLIPQLANVSSTSYHQSLLSSKPSKKQQSKFHHSSSPTKLPITRTPIKKSIQIRKKRKRKKKKKKGKKKGSAYLVGTIKAVGLTQSSINFLLAQIFGVLSQQFLDKKLVIWGQLGLPDKISRWSHMKGLAEPSQVANLGRVEVHQDLSNTILRHVTEAGTRWLGTSSGENSPHGNQREKGNNQH